MSEKESNYDGNNTNKNDNKRFSLEQQQQQQPTLKKNDITVNALEKVNQAPEEEQEDTRRKFSFLRALRNLKTDENLELEDMLEHEEEKKRRRAMLYEEAKLWKSQADLEKNSDSSPRDSASNYHAFPSDATTNNNTSIFPALPQDPVAAGGRKGRLSSLSTTGEIELSSSPSSPASAAPTEPLNSKDVSMSAKGGSLSINTISSSEYRGSLSVDPSFWNLLCFCFFKRKIEKELGHPYELGLKSRINMFFRLLPV